MAAAAVYHVGSWAIEPYRQVESRELDASIQRVAKTFFMGERADSRSAALRILSASLQAATQHARVLSATVRAPNNSIIAAAYKNEGVPLRISEDLSLPLLDHNDRVAGQIVFELSSEKNGRLADLKRQIFAAMTASFLIVGLLGYIFFSRRKEHRFPALITTLKHVAAGRFDVEIPEATEPEHKEMTDALKHMLEALQERDRMRHSLGRIMDPKLAEALIKEDPKLGGRTRKATILFCDIRNYTSLCEGMNPEELQEFLNEYWKGTVEIIMEQEGTIDKFHGDGVCVVFGAPALHEDDPLRAVRTAWRLVGNVASINERRAAQRKTPIQIGVGIHTGEVMAGHIGSERRMDYTVVGDVVNVAARIEELNKKFGTQILISDSVYEKVEDYVRVKTLTLAHLRGHKRPILIHALKEFHDTAIPAKNREEAA